MVVVRAVGRQRRGDGLAEDDVAGAAALRNDVGGGLAHHVDDVQRAFHLKTGNTFYKNFGPFPE